MPNPNTFCEVCDKNFSKSSNLRAHAKKFHPEIINSIAPRKKFNISTFCKECSKTFSRYSNYKSHVLKFHYDKKESLVVKKIYKFQCEVCQRNFSHLRHFQGHKKIHNCTIEMKNWFKKKCPLCDYEDYTKSQLINHFQSVHDLPIILETIYFSSFEEFIQWKTCIENTTNAKYVCKTSNQVHLRKLVNYRCHRSGIFKSTGKGIRRLKKKGSNKINGYCPAEFKLKLFEDGKYKLTWTKTHIGHDCDSGDFEGDLQLHALKNLDYCSAEPEEVILLIDDDSKILDTKEHILLIDDSKTLDNTEHTFLIKAVDNPKSNKPKAEEILRAEKNKLKMEFEHIIDNICSLLELEAAKKLVNPIQPTLLAIRKCEQIENLDFTATKKENQEC